MGLAAKWQALFFRLQGEFFQIPSQERRRRFVWLWRRRRSGYRDTKGETFLPRSALNF